MTTTMTLPVGWRYCSLELSHLSVYFIPSFSYVFAGDVALVLSADMVAPVLRLLAALAQEWMMKDWLGSAEGSVFWPGLLSLLCHTLTPPTGPQQLQPTGTKVNSLSQWNWVLYYRDDTVGTPYNTNVGVQKIPDRAIWKPVVAKRNNRNPCSKPQILVTRDSRQVHGWTARIPLGVNFSLHAFITNCLTTL